MNSGIGGMSSPVHGFLELVRDDRAHAGQAAEPGGEVHAGVADGGGLDVVVALAADGVHAEEGEEEVGLDALHARSVGHDQPGVDAFQRALGDDDRDLFDLVAHGAS